MVVNADQLKTQVMNEASGLIFKNKQDPRVTRGSDFEKHKLGWIASVLERPDRRDELRTRPPTADEVAQYNERHWQRLNVKPGLTGEWQVNGRSSVKDFEEVVNLDLRYQSQWSPLYDLVLIAKTIYVILPELELETRRLGQSGKREETSQNFKGFTLSKEIEKICVEWKWAQSFIKGFTEPDPDPFIYLHGFDATAWVIISSRPGYWGSQPKIFLALSLLADKNWRITGSAIALHHLNIPPVIVLAVSITCLTEKPLPFPKLKSLRRHPATDISDPIYEHLKSVTWI